MPAFKHIQVCYATIKVLCTITAKRLLLCNHQSFAMKISDIHCEFRFILHVTLISQSLFDLLSCEMISQIEKSLLPVWVSGHVWHSIRNFNHGPFHSIDGIETSSMAASDIPWGTSDFNRSKSSTILDKTGLKGQLLLTWQYLYLSKLKMK